MPRYLRKRVKVALLTIFCLLFQQLALAAYLCPVDGRPKVSAMARDCTKMESRAQVRDNPLLCAKHCHPDQTVTAAAKVSVPSLALPAVFSPMRLQPASCIAVRVDVPIARSDPPPRLQYCSLLI